MDWGLGGKLEEK